MSCPILCDPMVCSTPDFPVPLHFPEFAQVHVHWIGDVIQPSHPLSSSSPSAFLASGSFPMNQFFASGGQITGDSVSPSVLPKNIHVLFPLILTCLNSLLSKNFLQHHSSKSSILWFSAFFMAQLSHPYLTIRKTIAVYDERFLKIANLEDFPL